MPQEPFFTDKEIDRMKADAIRRARQMHARAHLPVSAPASQNEPSTSPKSTPPPPGGQFFRPASRAPGGSANENEANASHGNKSHESGPGAPPGNPFQGNGPGASSGAQGTAHSPPPNDAAKVPGLGELAELLRLLGLENDQMILLGLILLLSREENTLPIVLALLYIAL